MTAEHEERQFDERRPAGDIAVDIIQQLATSDLLLQYPHLGEELERILEDFHSIHTDGREWDRRVLVQRFDRLVRDILLITDAIVNPPENTDYSI
jgi:hypothetical protein